MKSEDPVTVVSVRFFKSTNDKFKSNTNSGAVDNRQPLFIAFFPLTGLSVHASLLIIQLNVVLLFNCRKLSSIKWKVDGSGSRIVCCSIEIKSHQIGNSYFREHK